MQEIYPFEKAHSNKLNEFDKSTQGSNWHVPIF